MSHDSDETRAVVRAAERKYGRQYARYIRDGDRAIRLHPDLREDGTGIEYETAASDMIASILHAYEFALTEGDLAAGGAFSPEGLLDYALDCYRGDMEDRPRPEEA
jgi:hypothetical protein